MKLISTIAILVLSLAAHADIPLGVFKGTDSSGKECQVEVVKIFFANNQHHPLNERAEILFGGETWTLAHPAVISESNSKVRFDHNFLQQIQPTNSGAKVLILKIDHNSEPHGPVELVIIDDNFRNAAATTKFVCSGLKQ